MISPVISHRELFITGWSLGDGLVVPVLPR